MEIQQLAKALDPAELQVISRIWLEGNLDAHPFIAPEYWQQHQAAVEKELQKAALYLARDAQSQIIGFAGMQQDYLAGIFVSRGLRDSGVGTSLLDQIKADHQVIDLHVYKANARALTFYRRNMFHVERLDIDEETFEMQALMEWQAK